MTIDELKIMVTLAGGRLLHYEREIFVDKELYVCYLQELDKIVNFLNEDFTDNQVFWFLYHYSLNIIDSRWMEAEAVIATNPYYAYLYAVDVIEGRWPEAESVIATDPQWAFNYAYYVIKGRWPEAESVIATNIWCAEQYNNEFGTNL
jgi:hypothetical protein